jgi:hypothetical protein
MSKEAHEAGEATGEGLREAFVVAEGRALQPQAQDDERVCGSVELCVVAASDNLERGKLQVLHRPHRLLGTGEATPAATGPETLRTKDDIQDLRLLIHHPASLTTASDPGRW